MKTKEIILRNDGEGMEEALKLAEEFGISLGLEKRNALHVILLAEEAVGMVRAITGEFQANFWIEGDLRSIRLHLEASTAMNAGKRRELMSVSSTGKNESAKGIMGKIRSLFETGMENYQEVSQLQMDYGCGAVGYGEMGLDSSYAMTQTAMVWSLQRYKGSVEDGMNENGESGKEAWDELEKSIVANIATDIRVGILRDKITLIIEKSFSRS